MSATAAIVEQMFADGWRVDVEDEGGLWWTRPLAPNGSENRRVTADEAVYLVARLDAAIMKAVVDG